VGAILRLFFVWVLAVSLLSCRGEPNQVNLENRSSEKISETIMIVANQPINLGSLGINEEKKVAYVNDSEGTIHVTVKFESGRTVSMKNGYVTSGMVMSHRIRVNQNSIELDLVSAN
jgi:hypothetical protein